VLEALESDRLALVTSATAWRSYSGHVDAGETELARVAYLERERLKGEADNAGERLRTLLEADA
jgi:hypothetical protein